jgi:hypothetical protein
MADRLHSFISLLCDAGVLEWQVDGRLIAGNQGVPRDSAC